MLTSPVSHVLPFLHSSTAASITLWHLTLLGVSDTLFHPSTPHITTLLFSGEKVREQNHSKKQGTQQPPIPQQASGGWWRLYPLFRDACCSGFLAWLPLIRESPSFRTIVLPSLLPHPFLASCFPTPPFLHQKRCTMATPQCHRDTLLSLISFPAIRIPFLVLGRSLQ